MNTAFIDVHEDVIKEKEREYEDDAEDTINCIDQLK